MKPLSIIIITYNRPDCIIRLVQNIASQQDAERLLESVIVIDNASTADYLEVELLINQQNLPFKYVRSTENLGVARGRNKAVELANAPIVITIDDDAEFRQHDALVEIEKLFQSDYAKSNNVGIFCFQVFYENGNLQLNAFPHKKTKKYIHKPQFLTSYYIGCGHAILKQAYNDAGLYPTDFFYGMEEYDLGYRILDKGYTIAYSNKVSITHFESPLGRTPAAEKLLMMWVNKSKVAYRYLPYIYFFSTTILWSFQFLVKTGFKLGLWLKGWNTIFNLSNTEKRSVINKQALDYIEKVEGRMWY
jgi:GT2 family glycosyltransferase